MTKVEEVARAIFDAEWQGRPEWERWHDKEYWFTHARAAVSAMHEPSEAMMNAGCAVEPPEVLGGFGAPGQVWRAMIDAALAEEPAKP